MYQYLAAPLTAWLLAQMIKFGAAAIRGDINFTWWWRSGGMPSAHSALVTALSVTVLAIDGLESSLFGVVAVFSMIVVYDSFGIRQAVGNHSKLLEELRVASHIDRPVKEILGHTFLEVMGGMVLGAVVGLGYTIGYWSSASSALTVPLSNGEFKLVAGLIVLCFVISLIFNLKSPRRSLTRKQLKKTINRSLTIPSVIALVFLLAAQQTIDGFSWRLWTWSILALIVVLQLILAVRYYRLVPSRIKEEQLLETTQNARKKRRKKKK